MEIIKFPLTNGYSDKPKVIALGKFESIHKGHREVLGKAQEKANELNSELVIMIFNERENNNIFSMEERIMFLNEYKPSYIMLFETNKENFSITHQEFEKFLKEINVQNVIVGSDFKYGQNREGDINTLIESFETDVIEKNDISTTKVMESIENKDFPLYKELMNHHFFYKGIVVRGEGNGKKFGMPTANVQYPTYKIEPAEGIYFSYLIYNGKRIPSLTSISMNPTLNAKKRTYETYIYDFDEEIYGEEVYVEIIEHFRDPIKFNSIDELIEQLADDKVRGEKYFLV